MDKVKEFLKQSWKYLLPLVMGIVIGILINLPSCNKDPEIIIKYKPVHDTITITKDSIVKKTKIKYISTIDTFYINKETKDTIYLSNLPIEHKQYSDTIKTDSTSTEIQINYSGFNSSIDSIYLRHNYFEKETTIIKPTKKVGAVWAVGVGVGFGGHVNINNGTFGYGPEIGLYGVVGIGGRIK